jgi:hypothetical protein
VYGGRKFATAVLWNREFNVTCREPFLLRAFPFVVQQLTADLRMSDPASWDLFNLTINTVQFTKMRWTW